MEQQSSVNRLYWLSDEGHWELVLESTNDKDIMTQANHLVLSMVKGVVGYAKYPAAPTYQRWTEYKRYTAGVRRRSVLPDELPKPILLLEMLQ